MRVSSDLSNMAADGIRSLTTLSIFLRVTHQTVATSVIWASVTCPGQRLLQGGLGEQECGR